KSIYIADARGSFGYNSWHSYMRDCNRDSLAYVLAFQPGELLFPLTYTLETPTDTYSRVINDSVGPLVTTYRIWQVATNITYGATVKVTVTDACGLTRSHSHIINPFNAQKGNIYPSVSGCNIFYYLSLGLDNVDMHVPLTLVVVDDSSG